MVLTIRTGTPRPREPVSNLAANLSGVSLSSIDPVVFVSLLLNGILVAVTIWYAYQTHRISIKTAEGAAAAERSALHSQKSAEAALRAAEISEASLLIEFDISLSKPADSNLSFMVMCAPKTANVWLHGIAASPIIVDPGRYDRLVAAEALDELNLVLIDGTATGPPPIFLLAGETKAFLLQVDSFPAHKQLCGRIEIAYSLTPDSPVHRRSSTIETRTGLYGEFVNAMWDGKLKESELTPETSPEVVRRWQL